MALTSNEMVMPVSPMYGSGGGNNGLGWGGDGWWLILLFLFAFNGGWGNGGYGNGGGSMPYLVNNDVQRGFDQSAIMGSLNGITSAISNGFANAEISRANTNTNTLQALWSMQMAQQQCCCDTRAAITGLGGTVASEACETRYANAQNTRDIIDSVNQANRATLDKLCQLELDSKNDRIADLERQLTMANLSASQTAQTSQILADNARQTVALEQYLNPVPVPAYVVANPNCCNTTAGCGCGSF